MSDTRFRNAWSASISRSYSLVSNTGTSVRVNSGATSIDPCSIHSFSTHLSPDPVTTLLYPSISSHTPNCWKDALIADQKGEESEEGDKKRTTRVGACHSNYRCISPKNCNDACVCSCKDLWMEANDIASSRLVSNAKAKLGKQGPDASLLLFGRHENDSLANNCSNESLQCLSEVCASNKQWDSFNSENAKENEFLNRKDASSVQAQDSMGNLKRDCIGNPRITSYLGGRKQKIDKIDMNATKSTFESLLQNPRVIEKFQTFCKKDPVLDTNHDDLFARRVASPPQRSAAMKQEKKSLEKKILEVEELPQMTLLPQIRKFQTLFVEENSRIKRILETDAVFETISQAQEFCKPVCVIPKLRFDTKEFQKTSITLGPGPGSYFLPEATTRSFTIPQSDRPEIFGLTFLITFR